MSAKKSTLEKIPLFPFANFLRINGEMQHNSQCGGIASIVAVCLLLAVLALKLVEVFKMETIVSSFQVNINLQPPMTNVSTVQDTVSSFPYMAALGYYQDMFYNSNTSIAAYYVNVVGAYSDPTRNITKTEILLQTCSEKHFSVIANITTKKQSWGYDSWKCLPLDKVWLVGGDFKLSTAFRRIQFQINCTYSENTKDCGYFKLYTLNSFINPSDAVSPSTYYIRADVFQIKNGAYMQYASKLDRNVLITDSTVLPNQKLNTTTSLESNRIIMQQVMNVATLKQTVVKIEKSVRSTVYNRSFLKLLDAAAYVGGIFSSILAVFFFMSLFGRFNFQMKFAQYYFTSKDAREVGFMSWIKQILYNVLNSTPLKPDWQFMQKRNYITDTVNKVLDIFYLHKRIGFLEQCLPILFEPHHIKGLHLVHSLTREEADQTSRDHQLRDRVVVYLSKYNNVQTFGALGNKKDYKDSQNISDDLPGTQTLIKSTSILQENSPTKKKGIVNQAESNDKSSEGHENIEEARVRDVDEILQAECRNIGSMTEEELDENSLVEEMQTDLKRLFEEGEMENGDQKSKIIYDKLNDWLKLGLERATKQNLFKKNLIRRRPVD